MTYEGTVVPRSKAGIWAFIVGLLLGSVFWIGWNWRSQPTPAEDCYCISLDDSLAEHYCTRADWEDHRVTVNSQEPLDYDVMLCEGDWVAVKHKHPLIAPDGSKIYKTSRWMIQRPSP